ncbi:MAG: glycosyltransferase family 2 protein [Gluconacetobacter diazotrophicus]|nr:glycosyltransferase family 2 protein [Gluconacetobacter diazotrophicus]
MSGSLGIAVTTYNRRDMVIEQVAALRHMTSTPFELVVCDDGSTDGTADALRALDVTVIGGQNRGVAWNKNRGLFFLGQHRRVGTIILLDDDAFPFLHGWEQEWLAACARFGHVNFIPPHYRPSLVGGGMTAANPGIGPAVGGMAIAQTAAALSCVGYMDVRFGRYGHEHSDYTGRYVRAGFGGFRYERPSGSVNHHYLIEGGIALRDSESSGTAHDLSENARLLGELADEPVYRAPWRSDAQMRDFLSDMPRPFQGAEDGLLPSRQPFSAEPYLARHRDVREAELDALEHFVRTGFREGRLLDLA